MSSDKSETLCNHQESASLLSEDSSTIYSRPKRSRSRWLLVANVIWTLGLVALTIALWSRLVPRVKSSRSHTPSPLLNKIDLSLKTITFNGRVHDERSIFRQPPSEAVDEAWNDLALEGFELLNATAADLTAAGYNTTTKVRWDENADAYPVQVEFAHKIHCLNEIRKEIWGEHYFGDLSILASDAAAAVNQKLGQKSSPVLASRSEEHDLPSIATKEGQRTMHRRHTMHCLHILLQDLMCNADLGIVAHDWVPMPGRTGAVPFADFSTQHQCRDFEAAHRWVKEHAVEGGNDRFSALERQGVPMQKTNDSYWD